MCTIIGVLVRIQILPLMRMVEGLVVTHTVRDPFDFTNALKLILKKVDIVGINYH